MLAEGDPLGLMEGAAQWLDRNGYLLDVEKLFQKALMIVVERAPGLDESAPLAPWIAGVFEDAKWALRRQDQELHRRSGAPPEPWEPRFRFLARALGIQSGDMLAVTIAMNGLPDLERRAVYAMLIRKEGFTLFAQRERISAGKVKDLLARSIALLIEAAEGRRDVDHD